MSFPLCIAIEATYATTADTLVRRLKWRLHDHLYGGLLSVDAFGRDVCLSWKFEVSTTAAADGQMMVLATITARFGTSKEEQLMDALTAELRTALRSTLTVDDEEPVHWSFGLQTPEPARLAS